MQEGKISPDEQKSISYHTQKEEGETAATLPDSLRIFSPDMEKLFSSSPSPNRLCFPSPPNFPFSAFQAKFLQGILFSSFFPRISPSSSFSQKGIERD